MRINKFIISNIILLGILILLTVLLHFGMKYTRTENIEKINSRNRFILRNRYITIPKDPYFQQNLIYLNNKDFRLYSDYNNSRTVEFLLKNDLRLQNILNKKKFESIYSLFSHFTLTGQYDEELILLKKWIRSRNSTDWLYSDSDQDELLGYLERTYLFPALAAYKDRQFGKCAVLIKKLCKRISLLNFKPSCSTDGYTNERVSKIYLSIVLLKSASKCLQYSEDIDLLIDIYEGGFKSSSVSFLNAMSQKCDLTIIAQYFKAICFFKANDYVNAKGVLLEELKNGKSKDALEYQLNNLLYARTIFWEFKKTKDGDYAQCRWNLKTCIDNCTYSPFHDDVTFYYNNLLR